MIKEGWYGKVCSILRRYTQKSSVSDDGLYPVVVKKAIQNEANFKEFRRNVIYRQIVEAPSEEAGKKCIKVLNQIWPDWQKYLNILQENDKVGNPYTYIYPRVGKMSPYTLQKMCELAQIKRVFPEMFEDATVRPKLRIAEIGVGYGGFFRLLYRIVGGVEEYTMFDLPDVLSLTEKYITCYPEIEKVITYAKMPEDNKEYDLVISNHAFNELNLELQSLYLKKVLRKAKHGFLIYSDEYAITKSKNRKNRYCAVDLINMIPNAYIIPLLPYEKYNSIVVW